MEIEFRNRGREKRKYICKKKKPNKGPKNLELKDEEELVSTVLMSELCSILLHVLFACKISKTLHIQIKSIVLLADS